jgi:hypothetical protein
MKVRKPKPPKPAVPGKPAGVIGRYELRRTLATVGYSALSLAISGATLVATFANEQNVGSMLGAGTIAGSIGLIITGICKLVVAWQANNTNQRG